MTLVLDGYDILRRIGASPEAFSGLRGTVAEVAETLVRQQLTSKTLDLALFRAIVIALGDETVSLVLQTLTPEEVQALAALLDPGNRKLASRDAAGLERHIFDLAHYRANPAAKGNGARARKKKSGKPRSRRTRANPLGTASMATKDR